MARNIVAAWALAGGAPLAAQAVVGTVTEAGSGRPLVGAMVRTVVDGTPTGHQFLTAEDGRYRILLPSAGTYWLDVERIGFAEVRAGPVVVAGSGAATFDVEVASVPVRLEGLAVEAGRRRCSFTDDPGGRTQAVWDQARKALAAASWTERQAGLTFEIERRVRHLDMDGVAVVDESRQVARGRGGNSVRTLSPEDLAEGGYVRDQDGYLFYYGPDAGVLLSETFLRTHCFRLREDVDGREELIGLAFEPVPDRDTTDIEGTVWLDETSLRLDRVEFSYTGLPRAPGNDRARGEVGFLELADGRWIVRDWFIQAPLLTLRRAMGAAARMEDRLMVTGVQEFGSAVVRAESESELIWSADQPRGSVRGTVWDSVGGRPLGGAEVRLAGRTWRTLADEAGRWTIREVPPGVYRIGFSHAALDSLGLDPGWREVGVRADSVVDVALAIPPLSRLLAFGCTDPTGSLVVGFVRDGAGTPVPGMEVRVVDGWPPGRPVPRDTTDVEGAYRLCDLPPGLDVRVEARAGPVRSAPGDARTRADEPVRVDLRLEDSTMQQEGAEGTAVPTLQGVAVSSDGQPVEGVQVELLEATGAVVAGMLTDRLGRFVLVPADGEGPYRVRTRHIAYATAESAPLALGSGTTRVEVRLGEQAIPLDEMVVEVERSVPHLERNGFYQRESSGLGRFLDREAIEAMTPTRPTDILGRLPMMTLMATSGAVAGQRPVYLFRRASLLWGNCPPIIYVDGAPLRRGGGDGSLDDFVSVEALEALEFYPSAASVPSQFSGPGANCGAIVAWTQRGPGG
ncbi:MAG: carboxypeptidase regulatory-like domain-containing protein [Longimicrobiales bacterium]